jgi:hypothetical protein
MCVAEAYDERVFELIGNEIMLLHVQACLSQVCPCGAVKSSTSLWATVSELGCNL